MKTPIDRLEAAAKKLIDSGGIINVTLDSLCEQADVQPGSFGYLTGLTFSQYMRNWQTTNPGPPLPATRARIDAGLLPGHLVNVGLKLATKYGYTNLTRGQIAEAAGVSRHTTHRAYPKLADLKRDIIRTAVEREVAPVVAQGIAAQDPATKKAPKSVKSAALKWLKNQ